MDEKTTNNGNGSYLNGKGGPVDANGFKTPARIARIRRGYDFEADGGEESEVLDTHESLMRDLGLALTTERGP